MKRFHIHVSVEDLARSIRFYSTLFGTEPSRVEPDYAKWMIEDPRVNFAISTCRQPVGVNHLGFQVDTADELREMHTQLTAADAAPGWPARSDSRAGAPAIERPDHH